MMHVDKGYTRYNDTIEPWKSVNLYHRVTHLLTDLGQVDIEKKPLAGGPLQ